MSVSEVDIANRALTKLGADRITSLTDDSVEANSMNALYEVTRDAELREHVWNFAVERVQLSKLTAAPTWGYSNQFQLPADCLRPLTIGDQYGNEITIGIYYRESYIAHVDDAPYQIEGTKILTDLDSPVNVRYLKQVIDPNTFDILFVDALACRLAVEAAADIIDAARQDFERLQMMYRESIRKAKRLDAIENPPRRRGPTRFVQARF